MRHIPNSTVSSESGVYVGGSSSSLSGHGVTFTPGKWYGFQVVCTLLAPQTGTIISQLDAYRAKSAGAEKYLWRSMEDRRVRPKHRELDGETFRYGDPHGGDDGQLPGEPIRCRCIAEPIF